MCICHVNLCSPPTLAYLDTFIVYKCILYMYVYQCIFIFVWEIIITISFTQSSIPSSTHQPCIWGESGSFATAPLVSKENTRYLSGRQSTRSIYIYTNMYQLCFLYFFETLHDTCRYVYIIICWSRDTNKTIFRGVNLVWNIFGELERLGMYSSLAQAIPTCSFSEALVFVVSRCGASCSRRC